MPKSVRSRRRWLARENAWLLTEWLITLFNYYELGMPKAVSVMSSQLGKWRVSSHQSAYAFGLFERIQSFGALRSSRAHC